MGPETQGRPRPLLELSGATVVLGGKTVLDDMTLRLDLGEHVAVLGPNGSGKSTLIRLLCGEVHPLVPEAGSATVRVMGQERFDLRALRARMGVVSDALRSAYERRVTAADAVMSGFFGSIGTYPHQQITDEMRERVADELVALGVDHLADRHMVDLSTGEARRVLIARAAVRPVEALVLDEPYDGLDPTARFAVRATLRRLAASGTTLVLVTHDISEIIPDIERVVMLKDGRVFRDATKADALQPDPLSELFGIDASVVESGGYSHLW